jgi:[CysO sulfur-carrier protein]-S-L-cysteine hydrolase
VPETVDEHGASAFSLRIARSQLDDIFAHARREAPDVCCGAVFGRDGKVTAVHPLENVAASPFRFEVEGARLLALTDKVDDEDALVAWYCSHTRAPQGPPYPS